MKINDTEMKARFFAQYFFQKVLCTKKETFNPVYLTAADLEFRVLNDFETDYLLLKPLSLISDEDASAITIYSDYSKGRFNDYGFYNPTGFQFYSQNTVDFIRLKGYALPFMQYSVEQLVEMNWIKLTES